MSIRFKCDRFVFEPEAFRIIFEDKELKLSHKESAVFRALCESPMRVVERKQLLSTIWNDSESCDISLNKNILLLRRKLESMGIINAIDTIPRVGYLLKLNIDVESSNNEEDECLDAELIDCDKSLSESEVDVYKKHSISIPSRYRKFSVYGVMISFIFFIYATVKVFKSSLYEGSGDNLPAIQTLSNDETTTGQVLLYTSNIPNSESHLEAYEEFRKNLKNDKRFYALMSRDALSYLSTNIKGDFLWQKIFLLDQRKDLRTQMSCIARLINTLPSNNAQPHFDVMPGLRVTPLSFYQSCGDQNKSELVGNLLIRSTLPLDVSKPNSTWIQDFTFQDYSGKELFHFKRVSRVHLHDNEQWNRHVSVKSINAEHLEQGKLQLAPLAYNVFEQFTQDHVYHMHIDESHHVYASSVFGGILYYVKRNPSQKSLSEKDEILN